MLDRTISIHRIIAIIYDTYHIVRLGQALPVFYLTIEGIESLVRESKIPRDMATIIYKLLNEQNEAEQKVNWISEEEAVEYLKLHKGDK